MKQKKREYIETAESDHLSIQARKKFTQKVRVPNKFIMFSHMANKSSPKNRQYQMR